MEKIILIGGGGHCRSVIDTIKSSNLYNIVGIIDLKEKIGNYIDGIRIIDSDDNLQIYRDKVSNAFITVGSIGNPRLRQELFKKLKQFKYNIPAIIDNTAIISSKVDIGSGTLIGKGAIVNSNVKIGQNCIINSGAIIEHDCIIEDFVHVASGSTLCGGVSIGMNSHIGAGSVILQYKNIGANSIVGAGSVVLKHIEDGIIVCGNPARKVKKNE